MKGMRRSVLPLLAAALSLPTVGPLAHAFLDQATPPIGGVVAASPKEVRLTFSEGIEPRFSGIELTTSDGQAVATASAFRDPANDKQLVLTVPLLAPGRYRVTWHVVSVDTHRTEGAFTFTVGP
jgi:methionine-rich copper-binding protein CopC